MSLKNIILFIIAATVVSLVIDLRQPLNEQYVASVHSIVVPSAEPQVAEASHNPTILAVGDIMLGRQVETDMNSLGNNYPFQYIDPLFESVDTVVANLEGPVLENHVHTPSGSFHFAFDTRMPDVLRQHNVHIVNLANNHTYDFGADGFAETIHYLDSAGILHAGNPVSIGSQSVLRTTVNGKKVIFVGFNFTDPSFNTDKAHAFIKSLNKAPDEYLIAMVHGGIEYELHSDPAQEKFYRGLIDDGVDVVLAHHPHVVEEIEQYKNKLIFYSLGNFIFDQYFSTDVQQELAVKIEFSSTSTDFSLIPVKSILSQPVLMTPTESKDFLEKLSASSSPSLKDAIQAGTIDIAS